MKELEDAGRYGAFLAVVQGNNEHGRAIAVIAAGYLEASEKLKEIGT